MRIYDPRVGKFLSVDPLSQNYAELSPYQFANNNPILLIDIDGMAGDKPQPSAKNYNNTVLVLKNFRRTDNPFWQPNDFIYQASMSSGSNFKADAW